VKREEKGIGVWNSSAVKYLSNSVLQLFKAHPKAKSVLWRFVRPISVADPPLWRRLLFVFRVSIYKTVVSLVIHFLFIHRHSKTEKLVHKSCCARFRVSLSFGSLVNGCSYSWLSSHFYYWRYYYYFCLFFFVYYHKRKVKTKLENFYIFFKLYIRWRVANKQKKTLII